MNQKILDEGYSARMRGEEECDNPYSHGTLEYDEWQAGWEAADIDLENAEE